MCTWLFSCPLEQSRMYMRLARYTLHFSSPLSSGREEKSRIALYQEGSYHTTDILLPEFEEEYAAMTRYNEEQEKKVKRIMYALCTDVDIPPIRRKPDPAWFRKEYQGKIEARGGDEEFERWIAGMN